MCPLPPDCAGATAVAEAGQIVSPGPVEFAQSLAETSGHHLGVNVGIGSTLRLPGCPAAPGTWNGYAGGFYLQSSSACVPLVFAVGRRMAVVRVGVGRRCGPLP